MSRVKTSEWEISVNLKTGENGSERSVVVTKAEYEWGECWRMLFPCDKDILLEATFSTKVIFRIDAGFIRVNNIM